ncbi:MAG: Flp family type IVb pilin [Pseudomonadota bacterium]
MQNLIKNFVADESGATAIEYGLIAALISVALIAGATSVGNSVNSKFTDVSTALDKASTNAGSTAPAAKP